MKLCLLYFPKRKARVSCVSVGFRGIAASVPGKDRFPEKKRMPHGAAPTRASQRKETPPMFRCRHIPHRLRTEITIQKREKKIIGNLFPILIIQIAMVL